MKDLKEEQKYLKIKIKNYVLIRIVIVSKKNQKYQNMFNVKMDINIALNV